MFALFYKVYVLARFSPTSYVGSSKTIAVACSVSLELTLELGFLVIFLLNLLVLSVKLLDLCGPFSLPWLVFFDSDFPAAVNVVAVLAYAGSSKTPALLGISDKVVLLD